MDALVKKERNEKFSVLKNEFIKQRFQKNHPNYNSKNDLRSIYEKGALTTNACITCINYKNSSCGTTKNTFKAKFMEINKVSLFNLGFLSSNIKLTAIPSDKCTSIPRKLSVEFKKERNNQLLFPKFTSKGNMDLEQSKDEETQMPKLDIIKSKYKLGTNDKDFDIIKNFSKTKSLSNDAVIKSKYKVSYYFQTRKCS